MMFLLCVSSPKTLPSPSLLSSMLGTNFMILILSILMDIIMIAVNLYVSSNETSEKKLGTPRILRIVDIAGAGIVLATFFFCALYMILSAPVLAIED